MPSLDIRKQLEPLGSEGDLVAGLASAMDSLLAKDPVFDNIPGRYMLPAFAVLYMQARGICKLVEANSENPDYRQTATETLAVIDRVISLLDVEADADHHVTPMLARMKAKGSVQ